MLRDIDWWEYWLERMRKETGKSRIGGGSLHEFVCENHTYH